MSIHAILLAGGSSTRFDSPIPKVFYPFLGKPLIEHLIDSLISLSINKITIVSGSRTDLLFQQKYAHLEKISIVLQKEPLGTLDAVKAALPFIEASSLLIINADTPLIRPQFLQKFIEHQGENLIAITHRQDPEGLGRVLLDKKKQVYKIVEQQHLTEEQKKIKTINAGIYKFQKKQFIRTLSLPFNTPEYYLTSSIGSYLDSCLLCDTIEEEPGYEWTLKGINSFTEMMSLEKSYFHSQRLKALRQGAILENASQIFIYGETIINKGVKITGPCEIRGINYLEEKSQIHPFNKIENITLGKGSVIDSFSHLTMSQFGEKNYLGPYLRSRGHVQTENNVYLGNFLEIKDLRVKEKTKAKHFGYLGNGIIGTCTNIGAGTIFCNYDGKTKQRTIIGNSVFVGACSQLIAPVNIGHNCYIGAGTLISKDLTASTLALRRAKLKQTENKMQLADQGDK